jgi:hypothetical protein
VTTDFGAESATSEHDREGHPGNEVTVPVDTAAGVGAAPHAKPAIEVTTDFGVGSATSGCDSDGHPVTEVTADRDVVPFEQAAITPSASTCSMHRDAIELGLSRGRNAMAIWQELVDTRGFQGGYQSVKRFVRKLLGNSSKEACAVIETAPGEEAQVDYGTGPMVRDPHNGKYRRMRLFVLTLGFSRKSIRLLVFQSSARLWAQLHEQAVRRLGVRSGVFALGGGRWAGVGWDRWGKAGAWRWMERRSWELWPGS